MGQNYRGSVGFVKEHRKSMRIEGGGENGIAKNRCNSKLEMDAYRCNRKLKAYATIGVLT
jgi:hypothetical protein